MSSDWTSKRTVRGQVPKRVLVRGRNNQKIMPKTKKDQEQDKELKNIKKSVRKLEGEMELKYKDISTGVLEAVTQPTTGTGAALLNPLIQGTTSSTRIGNEVFNTSLQIRGVVRTNPLTLAGEVVRLLIIYDKEPNGAQILYSQILDVSVITTAIFAPYNSKYFGRIKILYDETFSLNPLIFREETDPDSTTEIDHAFQARIGLNKKSTYIANNGDITDISQGAIWAFAFGEQTSASTSNPEFVIGSRVYYKDN